MKENKYDEQSFFEAYSRFPRSIDGLSAAGEWHELQRLLPELRGKRVLDLGCGFGWHCIYAAEQGAERVVGTDISRKMLQVAREKTRSEKVEYVQLAMEDMDFTPDSFDVVLSSLALHYIESFGEICDRVGRCLASGGDFVFSVEHPIFTAYGTQNWFCDSEGRRLHWPVDRYFDQGKRTAHFLGEDVVKYHRTLTTYMRELLTRGFRVTELVEPQPDPRLLEEVPGMEDELRRPMMLLIAARKEG